MNRTVIFMGTPQIAVPSLQALLDAGFNIPLIVSQPDKPKGRGNRLQPTPVKELAMVHNISVFQPETLRNNPVAVETLTSLKPDFFAVVAYGKILPVDILDIPAIAPVNVHFSLLPLYRGAAPVNWAIMNGDTKTGVSTMKMDAGMDTGDILLTEETLVAFKNAEELAGELSHTGAELLVKTLRGYESIVPKKQDTSSATAAPMMKKEDGLINWGKTAGEIERMIRAFVPWPAAYTYLEGKMLKISASAVDSEYVENNPGMIYRTNKKNFSVGTGAGGLIVNKLQPEGKRSMTAAEFLAGYKLKEGTSLG